jgi:hypothetical protein
VGEIREPRVWRAVGNQAIVELAIHSTLSIGEAITVQPAQDKSKMKRRKTVRQLSLVRLKEDWAAMPTSKKLPFVRARDLPLVFLGEIPNMPEHGVFVGYKSGRAYSGYHIIQFEEVPDDET